MDSISQYSTEKARSTHSMCGKSILVCQVVIGEQSIYFLFVFCFTLFIYYYLLFLFSLKLLDVFCQWPDLDIYSICCAD